LPVVWWRRFGSRRYTPKRQGPFPFPPDEILTFVQQSTHPYNGGIPRELPADPNRTKPRYWPAEVIHREPDHIGKDDRTNLLVHLIMQTPQEVITNPESEDKQYVFARDFVHCLEEKKQDLKEGPWEIIQQIVRVREMMEQFEEGEIGMTPIVKPNIYPHADMFC
jgi:hypothetical protein